MQPDLVERGRGGGHTMAFTAVQRGGKARMAPLPSHSTEEIAVFIRRRIDSRAVISTDELPAYLAIGRAQAGHIRVNHSALIQCQTPMMARLRMACRLSAVLT